MDEWPPMEPQASVRPILGDVEQEVYAAFEKFEPFHSPHEGLAVIWEEFEELKKHVWENTGRSEEARAEAMQLAAMAIRYMRDLC